ncbi:MAG TPA: cytochrome c-type biogenesis protein [Woeseiaceae bacterium]|nr:cytochrome c-type biogenesis protein [Woeseiaceae bacterium]
MTRVLVCLVALLPAAAFAIDGERLDDPELQARYERIITEVRCLQCLNQSIKDSDAFLASDLRREIRRLLTEGKSDEEIYDFVATRYGEFALYRPRFSGKTLLLWAGPLLLFVVGAFVAFRIVRGRMSLPIEDP